MTARSFNSVLENVKAYRTEPPIIRKARCSKVGEPIRLPLFSWCCFSGLSLLQTFTLWRWWRLAICTNLSPSFSSRGIGRLNFYLLIWEILLTDLGLLPALRLDNAKRWLFRLIIQANQVWNPFLLWSIATAALRWVLINYVIIFNIIQGWCSSSLLLVREPVLLGVSLNCLSILSFYLSYYCV